MKKRHKVHVLKSLERDKPKIDEMSNDISEVMNEFLHELETVSPKHLCEHKALNMLDCVICIVNTFKWLIGFIAWKNHQRKSRLRLKSE